MVRKPCARCLEKRPASVAIRTQRPTRANLWTKIWWEESEAPAAAIRYCGECTRQVLAELAKALT